MLSPQTDSEHNIVKSDWWKDREAKLNHSQEREEKIISPDRKPKFVDPEERASFITAAKLDKTDMTRNTMNRSQSNYISCLKRKEN